MGRDQAGNDGRKGLWDDGGYRREELEAKLIECMQRDGTEKAGLWFTHRGIYNRMVRKGVCKARTVPSNLNVVITRLVRSGHIERALKPSRMGVTTLRRFVYRRTSKAYKPKQYHFGNCHPSIVHKGRQLSLDHPKFPKWLRDMLIW
jgi:hypothetical protein